jgi:hypothetical protein
MLQQHLQQKAIAVYVVSRCRGDVMDECVDEVETGSDKLEV